MQITLRTSEFILKIRLLAIYNSVYSDRLHGYRIIRTMNEWNLNNGT